MAQGTFDTADEARQDAAENSAEAKAYRLHAALSVLLDRYKHLIKDTNSEPLFGEDEGVTDAERALFENRPLADWEPVSSTVL